MFAPSWSAYVWWTGMSTCFETHTHTRARITSSIFLEHRRMRASIFRFTFVVAPPNVSAIARCASIKIKADLIFFSRYYAFYRWAHHKFQRFSSVRNKIDAWIARGWKVVTHSEAAKGKRRKKIVLEQVFCLTVKKKRQRRREQKVRAQIRSRASMLR